MKGIPERLQERRRIEVAKNLLESSGYRVVRRSNSKRKLKEDASTVKWQFEQGDTFEYPRYTADYNGNLIEIYSDDDNHEAFFTVYEKGNKGKQDDDPQVLYDSGSFSTIESAMRAAEDYARTEL